MNDLSWQEFERVDIRLGTIIDAQYFPEARRPAYKLKIDFGEEVGIRKSSAQITDHYEPENLIGMRVMGVVNFPEKQIGPFMSQCLITGFTDEQGKIVLATIAGDAPNGAKLC